MSEAAPFSTPIAQYTTATPQPQRLWSQFIGWILRMLVAALFIYAAVIKIDDPTNFAKDIRNYEVFSETITNVMAYTVPWIEFVAATLLVIGIWRLEARVIIGGMLVAFTVLKVYVLTQGHELDCGCFGDTLLAKISTGWNGVYFNIGMLLALVVDAWLTRPGKTPAKTPEAAV